MPYDSSTMDGDTGCADERLNGPDGDHDFIQCQPVIGPGSLMVKPLIGAGLGFCTGPDLGPANLFPCFTAGSPNVGAALFSDNGFGTAPGSREIDVWAEWIGGPFVNGFDMLVCNDRDHDGICSNLGNGSDQMRATYSNEPVVGVGCADDETNKDDKDCGVDPTDAEIADFCILPAEAPHAPWNPGQIVVFIGNWVGVDPLKPNIGGGMSSGSYDVWMRLDNDGTGPIAACADPYFTCGPEPTDLASPPPYPFGPAAVELPVELEPAETPGVTAQVEPVELPEPQPVCPEGLHPYPIPPDPRHGAQPPAFGASAPYFYATAYSAPPAGKRDGAGLNTVVHSPAIANVAGVHSLNEIAVIAGPPATRDIVEIGWTKSKDYGGAGDVRLFVFSWVDGVPKCYNGCGWKQYSKSIVPGQVLTAGTTSYMGYVYYGGNWWAWWTNQWVGYYPGTMWSGTFTQATQDQWFGEVWDNTVVSGAPKPATDMGTGHYSTSASAAQFSTPCEVDAKNWVCWIKSSPSFLNDDSPYYKVQSLGSNKYAWGGPGIANGVGVNP